MPIVTIQVTREGSGPDCDSVTPEEKASLIAGVSQLLLDVLHKPLESTFVVIEEVATENWGWGGLPVLTYRKRLAAGGDRKTSDRRDSNDRADEDASRGHGGASKP